MSRLTRLCLLLLIPLAACGDNLKAADVDAGVDAFVCPARAPGLAGGACTTDVQCDSAAGAGDGLCLNAGLGGIGWPEEGYCINKVDLASPDCTGCTSDADCGQGDVCITVSGCKACAPACCEGATCPDGQVCTTSLIGADLGAQACLPGSATAVDGAPCAGFGDCASGSICFADFYENPGGYCTTLDCTVGDDATCADGGDGHCVMLQTLDASTGCVDACTADADCRQAAGYRCFDGGAAGRYCRHPQTGDACGQAADCGATDVWQCKTGVLYPGGYCTPAAQCNIDTGAGCTPGSSVCFDPTGPDMPYCVDRCTGQGQGSCRAGYSCAAIGSARGCVPLL